MIWIELQATECTVTQVDDHNGSLESVQIKHSALARALWFTKSRAGNWYWRGLRDEGRNYIVKGDLAGLETVPRRQV